MDLLSWYREMRRTRDRAALIILVPLTLALIWVLALPLSQSVQRIALERFHLLTPSFLSWAVQQPIPAMYNFENRAALLTDAPHSLPEKTDAETLNHFPLRFVTFADRRGQRPLPHRVILESIFRGCSVTTVWEVQPQADGGTRLVRVAP